MTRYQPRSLAPLPMTANHTLRPVIDELRAADPADAPPGAHVHFPEVAWPEPPPEPTPEQWAAFARFFPEVVATTPIADRAPWDGPIDATAALASLAEAEALAYELAATEPRRPTLLRRIIPTTATAFWMAVSAWLGFLLVRAEGWL